MVCQSRMVNDAREVGLVWRESYQLVFRGVLRSIKGINRKEWHKCIKVGDQQHF